MFGPGVVEGRMQRPGDSVVNKTGGRGVSLAPHPLLCPVHGTVDGWVPGSAGPRVRTRMKWTPYLVGTNASRTQEDIEHVQKSWSAPCVGF